MKIQLKEAALFLVCSLLITAGVYRDAMWGGSLLAPLDLGPFVFKNYEFMADEPVEIPDNHFIIDQFIYDLPLQKRIYESYRDGQIPWWDPYTYGGRPLLADAHINGTDPIRVALYLALPFEIAYNWNLMLRGLLTGFGMFLLLRYFNASIGLAVLFALAYQFAGWFTVHFGHPWIQGSFVFFPYVWLCWMKAMNSTEPRRFYALAAFFCAAIFYSGNIQSHTYLPIFAFAFIISSLYRNRQKFCQAVCCAGISGFIGALLAFPVLVNQLEFYLLSEREFNSNLDYGKEIISAVITLPTAIISSSYPWALGSFQTIQPLRGLGGSGVEFHLFLGVLSILLIGAGLTQLSKAEGNKAWGLSQSAILICIFFVIICTPLTHIFYARSAALAGMGMTILCALGMQSIISKKTTRKKPITIYAAGVLMISGFSSVFALFVYPVLLPDLQPKILQSYASRNTLMDSTSHERLRRYQIENFGKEVSLFHPEALLSVIGLICFSVGCLNQNSAHRDKIMIMGLILTLIPVIMFHHRFRPKHPISMWEKMEAGGPAQNSFPDNYHSSMRLDERDIQSNNLIFPFATAALYQVQKISGYSALQPQSIVNTSPSDNPVISPLLWDGDLVGEKTIHKNTNDPYFATSRFRLFDTGQPATLLSLSDEMNALSIHADKSTIGKRLVRTDTWYPGWETRGAENTQKLDPCFTSFIPTSQHIHFDYIPTGMNYVHWSLWTALMALIILLLPPRIRILKFNR